MMENHFGFLDNGHLNSMLIAANFKKYIFLFPEKFGGILDLSPFPFPPHFQNTNAAKHGQH